MEGYHDIPLNGGKTYVSAIDIMRLCSNNMWKCSFKTLQSVACQRGWDTLRRRYWEEKMLSILLKNAVETEDSAQAEKALKALRGKSVTTKAQAIDNMHDDAVRKRIENEFKIDSERMRLVVGGREA